MKYAIIGYTGFVGSNIVAKQKFDYLFDSKTIPEIINKSSDLLVLAAPSASMWVANQNPEQDKDTIDKILRHIKSADVKRIVYLSTVAVYNDTKGVDEETIINEDSLTPYGRNRLYLERELLRHYPGSLVVRLPALFGQGLKKNFIFDMKQAGVSEWTNEKSVYQFYYLENIWDDIQTALKNNISILNVTSEPLSVKEVARECFGVDFSNAKEAPAYNYDIRSKYAETFGGENGYMYSKEIILSEIKQYLGAIK